MSDSQPATFRVNTRDEVVSVLISGKANYMNCNDFRVFLHQMLACGRKQFVIDFAQCTGMDSTFLGILAGTAIELREAESPGSLIVQRLSERNHELVANLGLHNLLTVIDESTTAETGHGRTDYDPLSEGVVADTRAVLESHENLVRADASNQNKFEDVISFLKNQVDSKEG